MTSSDLGESVDTASAPRTYRWAHDIARRRDVYAWNCLFLGLRDKYATALLEWRDRHAESPPADLDSVKAAVDELIEEVAPFLAAALAGIQAGRAVFSDQRDVLDSLVDPPGWRYSGRVSIVAAPEALGFIFQALHGAMSVKTVQPKHAIRVAEAHVRVRSQRVQRVCDAHSLMGWSELFGQDCRVSRDYIMTAFERWDWLADVFASEREYRETLMAYHMLLHTRELARRISGGEQLNENTRPVTPMVFVTADRELGDRGYLRLLRAADEIPHIWKSVDVRRDAMESNWRMWMQLGRRATGGFRGELPHEELLAEVLG